MKKVAQVALVALSASAVGAVIGWFFRDVLEELAYMDMLMDDHGFGEEE